MITAAALAWSFAALSVVLSLLLAIAVSGNADLAAENRRLRKRHLQLVHPSTRRTTR